MAWPSIGLEEFISLSGRVQPLAETVEEISRANEDGHEFRTTGQRSNPTEHVSVKDELSEADARIAEDVYKAMRGTLQTVTYADGQSRANVLVMDIQVVSVEVAGVAVGGVVGGDVILTARWVLQGTE